MKKLNAHCGIRKVDVVQNTGNKPATVIAFPVPSRFESRYASAMTDKVRYDLIMQDALRGVVKRILSDAAKNGLVGEQHFYVSFHTGAPGVRLSSRLREKYPEEMTIVLQHQYWDLVVGEHGFEVGLSFDRVPERLNVPYTALAGFFDPSAQFGFKIEQDRDASSLAETDAAVPQLRTRPALVESNQDEPAEPKPIRKKMEKVEPDDAAKPEDNKSAAEGSAAVVSLDAFRKKK
jgi:uncharacterized protein